MVAISRQQDYIAAVCRELAMRLPSLQDEPIDTIYFGGGTPSLINCEALGEVFRTIDQYRLGAVKHCMEITLEANPDDLSEAYVQALSQLPVNRLSIGIQSFHDTTLQLIGRRHTSRQAIEAVRRCQAYGLSNISIDLIFGLPGETLADWEYNLQQALALEVKHISAYHLTYEEGTRLWKMYEEGIVEPVDEEFSVEAFRLLRQQLIGAGYEHYEISNFALPGYHSRHNSSYWQGKRYIGVGPGAHSYDGTTRQWNLSDLTAYLDASDSGIVPHEKELLTAEDRYNDQIITELRTSQGIDLVRLMNEHGDKYHAYCLCQAKPHLQTGRLACDEERYLHLTPDSIMISDAIMRDLIY